MKKIAQYSAVSYRILDKSCEAISWPKTSKIVFVASVISRIVFNFTSPESLDDLKCVCVEIKDPRGLQNDSQTSYRLLYMITDLGFMKYIFICRYHA